VAGFIVSRLAVCNYCDFFSTFAWNSHAYYNLKLATTLTFTILLPVHATVSWLA